MSAGNTSAIPGSDGLGEVRRDNAMASRVSFAAAKEQERETRETMRAGARPFHTRSVVMTILLGADTLQD